MTRRMLKDALTEMLKEKDIYHISIRELCERADVNRTTFYNHYGSQYDLLEEITQRFINDIAEQLACADADNRDSVQERVATVLSYLERHLILSRLLLNNNVDPQFAEKLISVPKITDLLHAALKDCPDTERQKSIISFAIHGSYHLLLEWINRDDRLPYEQQAAMILELARRVCGQQSC